MDDISANDRKLENAMIQSKALTRIYRTFTIQRCGLLIYVTQLQLAEKWQNKYISMKNHQRLRL